MVKKRENEPISKQVFIESSQVTNVIDKEDPSAPRVVSGKAVKSIALQFNMYEFKQLEAVANKTKRTKNSIIREGIEKIISELNAL